MTSNVRFAETSASSSSGRSRIPPSIEEMANRLKASMRDLGGNRSTVVVVSSVRPTEGGGAKCAGRGRGALLKHYLAKSPGTDPSVVRPPKIICSTGNVPRTSIEHGSLITSISDVLQGDPLDFDDSADMSSKQSCPGSPDKLPEPFQPVLSAATEVMQGTPEEQTKPFEEDFRKSNFVCNFQKLETREVDDCSKSEPVEFTTFSDPSNIIPTEKSEIMTKISQRVAHDYKGRPEEQRQKYFPRPKDRCLDESQRAKAGNPPRTKYNPLSQMIFGR